MVQKRLLGFLVAFFVVSIMFFSVTHAQAVQFTADMAITGPGGEYLYKLYVKDRMYRLQKIKGPMNVPPYPSIVNRDTGVTWGLNPQMKKYVEIADIKKTMMTNPLVGWTMTRKGMTEKPGPVETVNGYECKTVMYIEAGKSKPASKVWIAKKLNHLIREERFGLNKNAVMELKDIKEGTVKSDLFKIPAGFTKLEMAAGPPQPTSGTSSREKYVSGKPSVKTLVIKKTSAMGISLDPDRSIVITATGDNPKGDLSEAGLTVQDKRNKKIEGAVFTLKNEQTRTWDIPAEKEPWTLSVSGMSGQIRLKMEQFGEGSKEVKAIGHQTTVTKKKRPGKPKVEIIEVKKGSGRGRSLDPDRRIVITATGDNPAGTISKANLIVQDKNKNAIESARFALKNNQNRSWEIPPEMEPWTLSLSGEAGRIVFKIEQFACQGKSETGDVKTVQAQKTTTPTPARPAQAAQKAAPETASTGNIMFILDASGSMWGRVEGKAKIAIAKEVMSGLIKDLPDDSVVGLVAYGHRRKGDCNDVEELVPLGKIDKKKLIKTVQGLSPKGKTPISRSVRMTAERIKQMEDETTIILVSDGKETCDPDPCGLVKDLKEAGINFVMHVIGFDVTEEEKAQLECMAKAGGGEYFTAKTAKDFQMAAKAVVKKAAEKPPISLKVTCIKDEKPIKAYVQVLTKGGEKRVAEGWTSTEKPAAFRLPPGMYDICAQDTSVIQRPTVNIKDVEVVEGRTTEIVANFATEGILHVKAVKKNAPMKAYVKVFRQEDNKYMRDGWAKEDGTPAEFKFLSGLYKVKVQDTSVTERPVVTIENVEVKPGETVERVATFGEGGILHVKAVKKNAPMKAYVKVFRQEDNKYMRDGWAKEDGTPAEFKFLPGLYKVKVQDTSVTERPVVTIENVEVKPGETVERVATFGEGGILHVKAVKKNAPMKAYVKVFRQEDNKYMRDGWAKEDGTPAEFKFLPGLYKVKVQDTSVTERPVVTIENVEVKPGQTVERVATFGAGGILHVKAIKDNAPMKAYVKVFRQEDNKYMGDGWTKEDGSPVEYKLLPGIYKILIQDTSVKQRPEVIIENVEVKPDKTVERFASFVAGGVLNVKATKNGVSYKAYVKLYQQKDDKYMGDGWARADGRPAEYRLLPGVYYVKVEDRKEGSVREIRDIQLESGKTLTVNAKFPVEKEPAAPAPVAQPKVAPLPKTGGDKGASVGTSEQETGGGELLNGEAPLYPGAKVLKEKTFGPNSTADLEAPAGPEDVINFYKKALSAKGWKPGMSMAQGPLAVIQLKKGASQIMIKATGTGQKSMVNMVLMQK